MKPVYPVGVFEMKIVF